MTPSDRLRAMAEEEEKRADELEASLPDIHEQIIGHREGAASLRKLADEMDARSGLTIERTERTIRTMDVNTRSTDPRVKSGAGRATRKHAAQKKLYQKGMTISSLAIELKEGRPRVSAWFAEGDANRPIPRRHAEKLLIKYGIPLDAWERIAD